MGGSSSYKYECFHSRMLRVLTSTSEDCLTHDLSRSIPVNRAHQASPTWTQTSALAAVSTQGYILRYCHGIYFHSVSVERRFEPSFKSWYASVLFKTTKQLSEAFLVVYTLSTKTLCTALLIVPYCKMGFVACHRIDRLRGRIKRGSYDKLPKIAGNVG